MRTFWVFLLGSIVILAFSILKTWQNPEILKNVMPETVYELQYTQVVGAQDGEVQFKTFLPVEAPNQEVLKLDVATGSLRFAQEPRAGGLEALWEGISPTTSQKIGYTARIVTQSLAYELTSQIPLPVSNSDRWQNYLTGDTWIRLREEPMLQVLETLGPKTSLDMATALKAIHRFVQNEITTIDIAGVTNSVATLQLQQGNAESKVILFVALNRALGIPARVVRGYRLKVHDRINTHSWAEVWVEGHWIPFCVVHNHFAAIPGDYLRLHEGSSVEGERILRTGTILNETLTASRFLASPNEYRFEERANESLNLITLLKGQGLDPRATGLFLMFPLAAFIVAFLRNVVGLTSFGVFMPMLIAAACRYTGLVDGLYIFGIVIAVATVFHLAMERVRLHRVPRLSAVITLITLVMIALLYLERFSAYADFRILAMFPVIILAFTADQLHQLIEDRDWMKLARTTLNTVLFIVACYLVYSSALLRGVFGAYPELILLVLLLQLWVGAWVSLRLTEYFRFKELINAKQKDPEFEIETSILGMNSRNREIVTTLNSKADIIKANDKILSKEAFKAAGVPAPPTYFTVRRFREVDQLPELLANRESLVIKPANGAKGDGILLFTRRQGEHFYDPDGKPWDLEKIQHHFYEILNGNFSKGGNPDHVLAEGLIHPAPAFSELIDRGMPDLRIILHQQKPVAAMMRLPTSKSSGKANLHQGAIGVGINIHTGICGRGFIKGQALDHHPDTGSLIDGFQIPDWDRILEVAQLAQSAIPLGYAGVDLCLDRHLGPIVLEINARPGIEIQNVGQQGLKELLPFNLFNKARNHAS